MGHTGDTYERYYTPDHIARDFQAIYFGSPPEEDLIRSVARMGLTRDRRAPTELSPEQKAQIRKDPVLAALRQDRERYKRQLYHDGFRPLITAKGTQLYEKYEQKQREISSAYQRLQRVRLDEAIRTFYDCVDTEEITRQLSGKPATEILTLPAVEFELQERATIADMLPKPIKHNAERAKLINTLAGLCYKQETRSPRGLNRKTSDFVVTQYEKSLSRKRTKAIGCSTESPSSEQHMDTPAEGERPEIQSHLLYPMLMPYPVCLICIGSEEFPYEWRLRPRLRKDVLKKHLETHFRDPRYQKRFQCRHPHCTDLLEGMMHFKRHALDVHGVYH